MTAPRVLIVDPEALFPATIVRSLADDRRVAVVRDAGNEVEPIGEVSSLKPDVVLMDVRMPDFDGIEVTRRIVTDHPDVRVLILTSLDTDTSVLQALLAGASGYMVEDSPADALLSGILVVAAGNHVISAPIVNRLLEVMNRTINATGFYNGLSRRQIEILKMLASGMGNKQIAYKLKVRHNTVRNHVSNIYRKLRISDRSQAILYALRRGLVDL